MTTSSGDPDDDKNQANPATQLAGHGVMVPLHSGEVKFIMF
jgi:hypothetical protein